MTAPDFAIPVNLANPGQFFACCGLLELADRLWPGTEGWFRGDQFYLRSRPKAVFAELAEALCGLQIDNTMTPAQRERFSLLKSMPAAQLKAQAALEAEKKDLESLRRVAPILLLGKTPMRIDWFCDKETEGVRFKTWAGQQSVLDIAGAMQRGLSLLLPLTEASLWGTARGIGLPFNFDSNLGAQGSPLDVGFSFDKVAKSKLQRIESTCRPWLEFLSFVGLQRFRPLAQVKEASFIYRAWSRPLPPAVAAAVTCQSISFSGSQPYEFRMLYRSEYVKSFLPGQPYQETTETKRRTK